VSTKRFVALSFVIAVGLAACGDEAAEAPTEHDVRDQPAAAASFVSPSDGDTFSSPFTVVLNADGVRLTPAGIPAVGEGHLHVMVDIGCYGTGDPIPGPSEQDVGPGAPIWATGRTPARSNWSPGPTNCVSRSVRASTPPSSRRRRSLSPSSDAWERRGVPSTDGPPASSAISARGSCDGFGPHDDVVAVAAGLLVKGDPQVASARNGGPPRANSCGGRSVRTGASRRAARPLPSGCGLGPDDHVVPVAPRLLVEGPAAGHQRHEWCAAA
jgi:hypothetical protein